MKKPTIADVQYGRALDLRGSAVDTASFLIKNNGVVLSDIELDVLKNVRIHVRSPFTDIYHRVIESDKLSCYTILDCSSVNEQIPEILTLNDITIDGKYISQNIPAQYQNSWVNISPILSKRDAYNSTLVITDTPRLASLISRGMLCMSYNDSDSWLNPVLAATIIETYSKLLEAQLGAMYNLGFDERNLVRTIFAAYYAQLLGEEDASLEVHPLLYRCNFLGTPNEITERLNVFLEERQKLKNNFELSIDTICGLLAKCGPPRMKDLNSNKIYVTMSRGSIDKQAMLIALDYPPYWVYQLIASVNGSKNPNLSNLIRHTDMKKKIIMFANDLVSNKQFIDKVQR